ncbi:hypothetical protein BV898_14126 [Hypsibius exemplaris]|uniref:Uncharacterized protein n=1 Tax=Hypsibius exemplaris TaxID=2072580 RepID=A0A1W0W8Q4_HYPEX|nr:hypothetical protein BV898_14126 [Hypsibius exemplaris]
MTTVTCHHQESNCPPNSCSSLLNGGGYQFQDGSSNRIWQPDGCNIRYRNIQENVLCLKRMAASNHQQKTPLLAIVGDSRLRQLRDEFIYQITGNDTDDLANPALFLDEDWRTLGSPCSMPDILVLGAGSHTAKDCEFANLKQKDCVAKYKREFEGLLPLLSQLPPSVVMIWMPQANVNQTSMDLRGNSFFKRGVNSANMVLYNNAIKEVLEKNPGHRLKYWGSFYTSSIDFADGIDGIHLGIDSKHHMMQLLMNWMCNYVDHDLESSHWPFSSIPERATYCCIDSC